MGKLKIALMALLLIFVSFFVGRYSKDIPEEFNEDSLVEKTPLTDKIDQIKIPKNNRMREINEPQKRLKKLPKAIKDRALNRPIGIRPIGVEPGEDRLAEEEGSSDYKDEETNPGKNTLKEPELDGESITVGNIMDEEDEEDLNRLEEQMPEEAALIREAFRQKVISEKEAMEMTPDLEASSPEIAPLSDDELLIDE